MIESFALRFASTIRATRAGIIDSLATPAAAQEWLLAETGRNLHFSDADHALLIRLRQSVRALFAKAVAPEPPSSADAGVLPPFPEALETINNAAAPVLRQMYWDTAPLEERKVIVADDHAALLADVADATIDFFSGPLFSQVRACPAPRCVLYFIKRHPRQEWCSVACGNRARAARHYHSS